MSSSDMVDAASKLLGHIDRLIKLLGEAKDDVLVGVLKNSLDMDISKLIALVENFADNTILSLAAKQPGRILVNEKNTNMSDHSSPQGQPSAYENSSNSQDWLLSKQDKANHGHIARQDSAKPHQEEHKPPDQPSLEIGLSDDHGHVDDHEGHKERNQSLESSRPTVAIPSAMGDVERGFRSSSLSINHKDQPEEPSIAEAKSNIPRGSGLERATSSNLKTDPDSTVTDIMSTPFYTVDYVKPTGLERTAAQPSQMSRSLTQGIPRDSTSEEIDKMCPCALLGHACTKGCHLTKPCIQQRCNCSRVHVRATCRAWQQGNPCKHSDCYWGHDAPGETSRMRKAMGHQDHHGHPEKMKQNARPGQKQPIRSEPERNRPLGSNRVPLGSNRFTDRYEGGDRDNKRARYY